MTRRRRVRLTITLETDTLVGFACGHVFHLACLLAHNSPEQATDPEVEAAVPVNEADGYASRSVGAKVLHARLIRDRIADGCPYIVHKEAS